MAERNESGQFVNTKFTYFGLSGYQGALGGLGTAASSAAGRVGMLLKQISPLQLALGGLAAVAGGMTVSAIGRVGSEFEDVQTKLAGTLSALNFSDTFTAGLRDAEGVMDSLYAAAAKLPGETEDYIGVFTQALPVLSQVKGGLQGMTAYSNQYVAVMKSMGVETNDAAMNLMRMLSAGRGMAEERSPAFRQLLNYMRVLPGQANLTSKAFDAMSQAARTELLSKALGRMGPMVDHMQDSWTAVEGAMKSAGRLLFRQATSPLFDAMRHSMQKIADLILDSKGHLTEFGSIVARVGQSISGVIGGGLERSVSLAKRLGDGMSGALIKIQSTPAFSKLDRLFGAARGAMGKAVDTPASMAGAWGGAGLGVLLAKGIISALPGGMLVSALAAPLVMAITAAVTPALGSMVTASGLDDVIAGVGSWFLQLGEALLPLVEPLMNFGSAMFEIGRNVYDVLMPALGELGGAFMGLVRGVVEFLGPMIDYLSNYFRAAGDLLSGPLMTAFTYVKNAFVHFAQDLGHLFSWLGKNIAAGNKVLFGDDAGTKKVEKTASGFGDFIAGLMKPFEHHDLTPGAGRKGSVPGQRAGGHVVQDFRGSRFTIQQDFEKGFDPDRIAVAFAKDLQRTGEQRLQSAGFEPLFGVS